MTESSELFRALGEVADTNPETLSASTSPSFQFRYLDLSAVNNGHIYWAAVSEVEYATAPSRARRVLQAGDVLFGTVRPALQSHGYVDSHHGDKLIASTGFSVVRAKEGRSHSRYLFHSLLSQQVQAQSEKHAVGSNYPAVNDSDVRNFQIFTPPIREQAKVAKILDTLDTAIRQTEAIIEKLKQVKQGLLNDLLTRGIDANGELRPPQSEAPHLYKESPLGWIPKEWETPLLDSIAIRGSGHTPNKNIRAYWNGGVKWVSLADSDKLDKIFISDTDKEISELGIANSSAVLHPAGTVVLSRDAGIGKSAILAADMAVSQHFMAWQCSAALNNKFLYFWLQRQKPMFEGIAIGSTIKTIGLPYFKKLTVTLPTRQEQDRAVNVVMRMEQKIKTNELEHKKLSMERAGLMDDLLTGRVRVTSLLKQ